MKFSTTAAIAAFSGMATAAKDTRTFAVLRFTNNALTMGSVDPLVTPGKVSTHAHQVMGGSNFGLSSTGEDLMKSECTNAKVKGDFSNYWFPKLYFHDESNEQFEEVEVFYVNAYYFFEPTNDDIKAFPVGLGIFSGDPSTRIVPEGGASTNLNPLDGPVQPISFVCPRDGGNTEGNPSWPKGSDGSRAGMVTANNLGTGVGFPTANCDGYASPLRADVHFPSCYNPDKGLLDYKNNMAWPEHKNGKQDCPKGWIHVPHLFLEVYWNTPKFADRWTPGGEKQPFVLANGDVTGYSSHADFMSGWDEDVLQNIIDNCDAGTAGMDQCPGVEVNDEDCTIPNPAGKEDQCTGTMSALPRDNPLSGFGYGAAPSPPSGGGSGNGGSGSGGSDDDDDSDSGSDGGYGQPSTPETPETDEDASPEAPSDVPSPTDDYASPKPTLDLPGGPGAGTGIKDPKDDESADKPVDKPSGKPKKPKVCKRSKSKKSRKARKARKAKKRALAAQQERDNASANGSHAARASTVARQHVHTHQQGVRRHSHGHHH